MAGPADSMSGIPPISVTTRTPANRSSGDQCHRGARDDNAQGAPMTVRTMLTSRRGARRLALATAVGLGTWSAAMTGLAAPASAATGDALVAGTAFGAVVKPAKGESYQQALARSESRYGRLGVIRYFDSNSPDSWSTFTNKLGDHTAIISFRISPTTVLSGSADSQLLAWFRSAPTDRVTYWSYMHEPEDDIARGSFTMSSYRNAFARIAGLARQAGNPQLRSTLILMCYTVNPASGRTWTNYYPGDGVIDVLGWDCYNHGENRGVYGKPATLYSRAVETSRAAGLPWGMAEIGSRIARGDTTGAGRAAWLTSVAKYLHGEGAEFVSYFDTNGAGTDYRLLDEPSRQAWYDVVSDQTP